MAKTPILRNGIEIELTKQQAIALHKEMWEYIHKKEIEMELSGDIGPGARGVLRCNLKRDWIEDHGWENISLNCFLCSYDRQEQEKYSNKRQEKYFNKKSDCMFCPCNWAKNPTSSDIIRCCAAETEYNYGIDNSSALDIANLPPR